MRAVPAPSRAMRQRRSKSKTSLAIFVAGYEFLKTVDNLGPEGSSGHEAFQFER